VGFSNWAARYGESAIPPLMGHPGLLIQDYVAGIPIWYIPNTLLISLFDEEPHEDLDLQW
jgi:hypothetical protein